MIADLIREAAALMRSRAANASPDIWSVTPGRGYDGTSQISSGTSHVVAHYVHAHDREHIVGMQPAVALAIADWLDKEAAGIDLLVNVTGVAVQFGAKTKLSHSTHDEALAVARTYLGRPA